MIAREKDDKGKPEEPQPPKWPPDVPMPNVVNPDPPPGEPDPVTGRPASEPAPEEGQPGYVTPQPTNPPPKEAATAEGDYTDANEQPGDTDDPDELEDELEQAEEEGDVERKRTVTRTTSKKGKPKR